MKATYFISDGKGHVKIGESADVHARISQLQTGSPSPLVCLGVCDAPEAELHEWFDDHRIQGEWFRMSEEMELWIEEHTRPLSPKKTVPIKTHKDMDGYIPDEELKNHKFHYFLY
jgi:hypothetical protein